MSIKSNIYKKRKVWWLNPWVIAIALLFILVSIPMVLWIASYNSIGAVMMFVITYLSLLVFVLFMVKKSMLEPHLYVDEKEIEKKRRELEDHRRQVHQEFLKTELEVLHRGERTTVLDVWRLNPTLTNRHPYFQAIETVLLDPKSQELHIRIQIGEIQEKEINTEPFVKSLLSAIISFIKIIVIDVHLQQLKQFFQILIIELYALRENENHRNAPYPIFSILFRATAFQQLAYISVLDFQYLKTLGDILFDGGSEIIPHRGIESITASDLK